jgi:hypothetical protein
MGIMRSVDGNKTGDVLWPEERSNLKDMIQSFTYNGAYANFLEGETISIEEGKQADIVVLDQNLYGIPPTEPAKTKVLLTLVAGKEVFIDSEFA